MRLSKRNRKLLLLGLIIFLTVQTLLNWEESLDNFERGFFGAQESSTALQE